MTNRHTLSKAEKLKSRKSIESLFAGGKSFTAFPIKVVYILAGSINPPVDELRSDTQSANPDILPNSDMVAAESPSFLPGIQIGVSASKRSFKKAVDRNRVKRLLREAYRLNKQTLAAKAASRAIQLQVFFIFLDKTLPGFALVEEKMKYCLRRLGKIVEGGS